MSDKYEFSDGPAWGHEEHWRFWLRQYAGQPNLAALEIGSYEGKSAVWLLDNVLYGGGCTMTCIDCWDDEINDGMGGYAAKFTFTDNIVASGRCDDVEIMHEFSAPALMKLATMRNRYEHYDICYIDGGHDARTCLTDSVLAWPLVKRGGTIIWDDHQWNLGGHPTECPQIAIDSFLRVFEGQYEILGIGWQLAVRKR